VITAIFVAVSDSTEMDISVSPSRPLADSSDLLVVCRRLVARMGKVEGRVGWRGIYADGF
jgi:hypothetical protein